MRSRFVGIIGNILGHYNRALFGLLAPFLAPLFFPKSDPLMALILTYGMMPLGTITKPLGALFFGWLGDRFGRRQSLFFSLMGMAFVAAFKGCLPTYSQIGIWAPCLLALARMVGSFFASGQSTSASIFILENTPLKKRSLMSSFYDVSSISGLLLASILVTFFSMHGWIENGWRLLFWISGLKAIVGLLLRLKTQDCSEFQPKEAVAKLLCPRKSMILTPVLRASMLARAAQTRPCPNGQARKRGEIWRQKDDFMGRTSFAIASKKKWGLIQALKEHRGALVSIAIASGFSFATYTLAFTLMNGYVPLVTSLAKADVMKVNTALLVVDMLLLPCFGFLAHKFGKEKIMLLGALGSAASAIPLFYCLDGAGIAVVTAVRFFIVFFGVAFAAPYHAWKLECVPPEHRYTLISLGCTLGSQLIGAPTSVICLWLYHQSGYVWSPGIYLMVIGLLAGVVIYRHAKIGYPSKMNVI